MVARFVRSLLLVAVVALVAANTGLTWAVLRTVEPETARRVLTEPGRLAGLERLSLPALAPLDLGPDVIYLNREGATLHAGPDDAADNSSSLVMARGLDQFDVPAFRGSAKRWDSILKCVRGQFEAYDVQVTDQRPVGDRRYVMVMVGGKAGPMADTTTPGETSGLAPRGSGPIRAAVAYVFSRTLKEHATKTCETIAHEIGHTYGLDHSRTCKDPMSYRTGCGRKSFQDAHGPCGEGTDRACANGDETQNSHELLLDLIGPKDGEA